MSSCPRRGGLARLNIISSGSRVSWITFKYVRLTVAIEPASRYNVAFPIRSTDFRTMRKKRSGHFCSNFQKGAGVRLIACVNDGYNNASIWNTRNFAAEHLVVNERVAS